MPALDGKKIAFLVTDGYEDSELTSPWEAVTGEGAQAVLVSPKDGTVTGKKGHEATVDEPVSSSDPAGFDALVLPGGVVNSDKIRMDEDAVSFARHFFDAGKPVGVICHGGWILTDADVVRDRTLTSYPSLRTDLRNAGATWVDEEVHVDRGLVSSRTPEDLPAFNAKIVEEFAAGPRASRSA